MAMRVMVDFMRTIMRLPWGWVAWVGVLFVTNIASVAFLPRIEAVIVLAAIMLGAAIQMAIFGAKGFVRLLGIGHFQWLVMVPWLLTRFDITAPRSAFEYWLLAVVVIDVLSLVIDVTDVARYAFGDRQAQLSVDQA